MKKLKNNQRGITLVTLIITIVVLLILASIGTYSGIAVIKSSKFTKFTTEMKIMQTQVNALYEKYKNGDNEILNLGKGLDTVQTQANIVFTSSSSGIIDQSGYKYFDQETIQSLNIEGVEGEFFINIPKRSVVSYEGFKYEGITYYTLEQLPSGLYNVQYNENTNTGAPTFDTKVEQISMSKWRITISNIIYTEGYIDKWQVKYKLSSQENWNTSEDLSFVVTEAGKYIIQLVNENIKSTFLPLGYQQVEYIRSTGTQYINTNLYPNNTMKVEIDTVSANGGSVFGGNGLTTNALFNLTANSTRSFRFGESKWNNSGYSYQERAHIIFGRELYLNDELIYTFPESTFRGNYPLILFGRFDNSNTLNDAGKVTIYSCKIYDNDELVRNFIPCYKEDSGEIGLYDVANDEFYTNQGTGTFEKGVNVNNQIVIYDNRINLPSEYQQVEYIEGTGTQYILTDIKTGIGFKLEADVYMSSSYTEESAFAGARFDASGSGIECYFKAGVPYFWANIDNMGRKIGGGNSVYNKKIHYVAEFSQVGMRCETDENGSFSNSYVLGAEIETPLMFFAYNANGTPKYHFRGRAYDLKIFTNDILKNNFIPCYRKSDNVIGMYDIVEGKFHTNQGTGTFEKGADVN